MNTGLAVIDSLRVRITRALPAQIRDCVALLDEEQLWWRPNEASNSAGNLVLHITGSLNLYLNHNIGGIPYERDRDREFAERGPIPKSELLARFDDMIAKAETTFDSVTPERLGDPSPEPKMNKSVVEDLINIAVHFSTHVGQIVWITKMLHGGAVDEVWIRNFKTHVWRR